MAADLRTHLEHVEPDGCEMGPTDHRRSPKSKIKHWLAILQDFRPWGPCVVIERVVDRLFEGEEAWST